MPHITPVVTVPVRLDQSEHRRLADFFGRYRTTKDGYAFYIMTERRAERYRKLREAGLIMAESIQKRGVFFVPGQKSHALALNQAEAVADYVIACVTEQRKAS